MQLKLKRTILLPLLFATSFLFGQGNTLVDGQGVLRWSGTMEEIHGFGVNYTAPFAHAYRSAKKLGVDPLKAIDQEVYHFARLGFDLYRVHVWDTEISDSLGNLLFNENLHAFDYLLHKLAERNIKYVLTPIAYWGNGWPEPDQPTPGFSSKYGKGACLTHPRAIKAQANYLAQFMEHVNPYTGVSYKNDSNLIAIEISNEPHHRGEPEKVRSFVSKMVQAVKKTGFRKPIFYNISHGINFVDQYFEGGISGGTFQWYPTGLGYQSEIPMNVLPSVDRYAIPFEDRIKHHKGAKIVYEFDAADIGKSYVYPAMARSFRTAGIQLATHFAYDPTYLAYANTEYNTHYMNLNYIPSKAISLMICAEVFRQVPMYEDYGAYPSNTSFGAFEVDYEKDLATLNDGEKYYHTNHSTLEPKAPEKLKHIAGCGSSPLVRYNGEGAYFLDRLEDGSWRLEVQPDPLIIKNPYGRNSLDKTIAVIQWNQRKMEVDLPGLSDDFNIIPLNKGNRFQTQATGDSFNIEPGTYVLTNKPATSRWNPGAQLPGLDFRLGEYFAPANSLDQTYVLHEAPETAEAGKALILKAEIASQEPIREVYLQAGRERIPLKWNRGFTYQASLPAEQLTQGIFSYYLILVKDSGVETYPAGKKGMPWGWDFYERKPYQIHVLAKDAPIVLFDAGKHSEAVSQTRWNRASEIIPLDNNGRAVYALKLEQLFRPDGENPEGPKIFDHSLKHYLNPALKGLRESLNSKSELRLEAKSLSGNTEYLQIALTDSMGNSFGKIIKIKPGKEEFRIRLSELEAVQTAILPRPYPTFLPYYFEKEENKELMIKQIESIQFSVGPGIPDKDLAKPHKIGLLRLIME